MAKTRKSNLDDPFIRRGPRAAALVATGARSIDKKRTRDADDPKARAAAGSRSGKTGQARTVKRSAT
jgi:hypothetical protein